jgi:molybdate transport system permease protein
MRVAAVATAIVFGVGTSLAWLVVKRSWRGKTVVDAILIMPLVLPPTVTGYLWLILLGREGPLGRILAAAGMPILFTWWAAVLASATVSLPLMYAGAKTGFQSVDESLEGAARTLGQSGLRVFLTVTLPLARPGIAAGLLLTFVRALGEFGATLMVAGNMPGRTQTIPLAIWVAAETGDVDTAALLVGIMLVLAAVGVWFGRFRPWGRPVSGTTGKRS